MIKTNIELLILRVLYYLVTKEYAKGSFPKELVHDLRATINSL